MQHASPSSSRPEAWGSNPRTSRRRERQPPLHRDSARLMLLFMVIRRSANLSWNKPFLMPFSRFALTPVCGSTLALKQSRALEAKGRRFQLFLISFLRLLPRLSNKHWQFCQFSFSFCPPSGLSGAFSENALLLESIFKRGPQVQWVKNHF